tara:strand:+ start:169378 stop:169818 length:441 start_codon:yes stop_codon:yes gene_type:complete
MFLRKLAIIHTALVIGLLVFGTITYFFGIGFVTNFDVNSDVFVYVVPLIALLGYFGSIYIFKKQLQKIKSSEPLQIKLDKYQTASITKYALIEGPTLLIFFQFMNSGYALYFTIACCLLLYLAVQRPNKNRLIQELNLNTEEQRQL